MALLVPPPPASQMHRKETDLAHHEMLAQLRWQEEARRAALLPTYSPARCCPMHLPMHRRMLCLFGPPNCTLPSAQAQSAGDAARQALAGVRSEAFEEGQALRHELHEQRRELLASGEARAEACVAQLTAAEEQALAAVEARAIANRARQQERSEVAVLRVEGRLQTSFAIEADAARDAAEHALVQAQLSARGSCDEEVRAVRRALREQETRVVALTQAEMALKVRFLDDARAATDRAEQAQRAAVLQARAEHAQEAREHRAEFTARRGAAVRQEEENMLRRAKQARVAPLPAPPPSVARLLCAVLARRALPATPAPPPGACRGKAGPCD